MEYLDIKVVIIFVLALVLLASYVRMKRKVGQELIVAALFALFITAYVEYVYEGFNVSIGSINLFPLVGWTAGLVFLRETYERLTGPYRFAFATAAYVAFLFAL